MEEMVNGDQGLLLKAKLVLTSTPQADPLNLAAAHDIIQSQQMNFVTIVLFDLETTGSAGGGTPQKVLASSIERSELLTATS